VGIWNDMSSAAHIITAVILTLAHPLVLLAGTGAYLAYQLIQEDESTQEKLEDIVEWMAGIVAAALYMLIVL